MEILHILQTDKKIPSIIVSIPAMTFEIKLFSIFLLPPETNPKINKSVTSEYPLDKPAKNGGIGGKMNNEIP